jgi:hypothetical protein
VGTAAIGCPPSGARHGSYQGTALAVPLEVERERGFSR